MKFKADQTDQKLRGGYYTPQNIADYVASWVLESTPSSVLEPSCGDGVFISALHHNSSDKAIKLHCFELFDIEVKKAKEKCYRTSRRTTRSGLNDRSYPYSKSS